MNKFFIRASMLFASIFAVGAYADEEAAQEEIQLVAPEALSQGEEEEYVEEEEIETSEEEVAE